MRDEKIRVDDATARWLNANPWAVRSHWPCGRI